MHEEIRRAAARNANRKPLQVSAGLAAMLMLAVVASAAPTRLKAQAAVEVTNAECLALNDPYACCSDLNDGTCDGKYAWLPIKRQHQYAEFCASFWYDIRCDNLRDGEQWLVAAGTCTQEEADASAKLPVVECTEARAENGYCRGDLGCAADDDPWNCCSGLNTGNCKFQGSLFTPKPASCRKAFDDEMLFLWKSRRKSGFGKWFDQDNPAVTVPDESVN